MRERRPVPRHGQDPRGLADHAGRLAVGPARPASPGAVRRDPDPAIEEFNYVLGIQQDHQEAKELLLEASKLKNELSQQQHIESMISNAVALFHQEKYSEALAVFNDILEIRPDEPTSLEYKTKIAAYYDSLKQQEAFNSQLDGFYSQAMVSYNARNYLKSRENFMNVFSLNSNYLEVKKYLALIQMRLSEEQARKIQEQQDKIVEYLDNGIAYYQVADYKNAIFDLSKCLELDPQNTFAKEYLDKAKEALFAKSQEDIDDDSPYYEIVIKLYRDAIAFYNAGEYQRSMTYLEKILLLFPNNKNTRDLLIKITLKVDPAKTEAFLQNHYNTGVDLYKNKEYPNSLKEFNLINSIRSNYKNIAEYIGKIDEKLNPETLSIPLPVLKESFDKGLVYYSEGKFDMAKREWEKVIQDNSDRNIYRVKAIINLNKINLKNKFNADTTPVVEQGAMSDKDIRVNQYYLKGVSLYVNGDYAQALQEWESGLKIDPNNRKLINSANKCRIKLEVQKTQKE